MKQAERELAKKLFAVFVMLRDSSDFPKSGTAKILKEKDAEFFRKRAEEEFAELVGCISGEHRHSDNFEQDFLLESSQVFYWLALAGVVERKSFEELEVEFAKDLVKLEKLHAENDISLGGIFEKDLKECGKKGYLENEK